MTSLGPDVLPNEKVGTKMSSATATPDNRLFTALALASCVPSAPPNLKTGGALTADACAASSTSARAGVASWGAAAGAAEGVMPKENTGEGVKAGAALAAGAAFAVDTAATTPKPGASTNDTGEGAGRESVGVALSAAGVSELVKIIGVDCGGKAANGTGLAATLANASGVDTGGDSRSRGGGGCALGYGVAPGGPSILGPTLPGL
mmetsp:Transcript_23081/g.50652  ORF Transcript_23081/g.50652 Transcript_23081/m.50652 type:complete len:206 (+) Transcript_23081:2548-3165(+)